MKETKLFWYHNTGYLMEPYFNLFVFIYDADKLVRSTR